MLLELINLLEKSAIPAKKSQVEACPRITAGPRNRGRKSEIAVLTRFPDTGN